MIFTKQEKKRIAIHFGILCMYAVLLLMMWTFYTAYNSPEKEVTVLVDSIGEGDLEAYIAVPLSFLAGTVALYLSFEQVVKGGKDDK